MRKHVCFTALVLSVALTASPLPSLAEDVSVPEPQTESAGTQDPAVTEAPVETPTEAPAEAPGTEAPPGTENSTGTEAPPASEAPSDTEAPGTEAPPASETEPGTELSPDTELPSESEELPETDLTDEAPDDKGERDPSEEEEPSETEMEGEEETEEETDLEDGDAENGDAEDGDTEDVNPEDGEESEEESNMEENETGSETESGMESETQEETEEETETKATETTEGYFTTASGGDSQVIPYHVPSIDFGRGSFNPNAASEIYEYLTDTMDLNHAAAVGILANIELESAYSTSALGDGGTSYGLCQWHNERFTSLVNYCSSNGYDYASIEGQMAFLEAELSWSYPTLTNIIYSAEDTADAAYDVAYYWCMYYERPSNTKARAMERGYLARESLFNMDFSDEDDMDDLREIIAKIRASMEQKKKEEKPDITEEYASVIQAIHGKDKQEVSNAQ